MENIIHKDRQKILEEIPPFPDSRYLLGTSQSPKTDICDLLNNTSFGVSFVCLEDAFTRFFQIRYAITNAQEQIKSSINNNTEPSEEVAGIFLGKFYLDYAAILFYACFEDIAEFIKFFLCIDKEILDYLNDGKTSKKIQKSNITSQAGILGNFMKDRYPNHEISKIIKELRNDINIDKTLDYRNTWVHDKPPIIAGLGIEHDRKSRIKKK